jgi:hypothetical protein
VEGRLETLRQIQLLDPRDETFALARINTLMLLHRYDEAQAAIERVD